MRKFVVILLIEILAVINLFMWCAPLSVGSGDDAVAQVAEEPPPRSSGAGGFYAWITERDQVTDAHLLTNVWVRVWPSESVWPGIGIDMLVGEHKEVNVRCDIVFGAVSMPSRHPDLYQSRSNALREQARGREAIAFIRNVLLSGDGDMYLENVRADGAGRFLADVSVVSAEGKRSLIELLIAAGHARHGQSAWGARLVKDKE